MGEKQSVSRVRKVTGAGLCAACCAVPMLVIAGVVSVATLVTFGVAAALAAGLSVLAWAVATSRAGSPNPWIGRSLAVAGVVLAAGAWRLDGAHPTLVATAVSLLAGGALVILASADRRPDAGSTTTRCRINDR